MTADGAKIFRFGVFEADTVSGELRKSGAKLRLQEQPFQVLLMLLEQAGEIVTRDELRQKLWPVDTFVDFDRSLNTLINRIREVLGDSASHPRFVETLARRGYRFVAPVEVVGRSSGSRSTTILNDPVPKAPAPNPPAASLLTQPEELPTVEHGYVRILFVLIQLMYLSFYIGALARISAVQKLLQELTIHHIWPEVLLVLTAVVGIPMRFYLFSAASFDVRDLGHKFLRLFPAIFVLDELWALSPFLLAPQIGSGLALGITAALIYLPFAQRTLVLMRERSREQPPAEPVQ